MLVCVYFCLFCLLFVCLLNHPPPSPLYLSGFFTIGSSVQFAYYASLHPHLYLSTRKIFSCCLSIQQAYLCLCLVTSHRSYAYCITCATRIHKLWMCLTRLLIHHAELPYASYHLTARQNRLLFKLRISLSWSRLTGALLTYVDLMFIWSLRATSASRPNYDAHHSSPCRFSLSESIISASLSKSLPKYSA